MKLPFAKYHGLGNDFVLVRGREGVGPREAIALCDRRFGIGADGVLRFGILGQRAFMDVLNADGSTAEMCGNGIRCVAIHLFRTGEMKMREFEIDTEAGIHQCRILEDERVEVTMAVPSFAPEDVPVTAPGPVIDEPWNIEDTATRVTAVSLGNPHVVTFDSVGEGRIEMGPRLATDPRLPAGANVGFATMHPGAAGGPPRLELHVFERGAGWTRACGTGACAAAVAAAETKRLPYGTVVDVELPGGTLTVGIDAAGAPVRMTGPGRHVFDGSFDLEALDVSRGLESPG